MLQRGCAEQCTSQFCFFLFDLYWFYVVHLPMNQWKYGSNLCKKEAYFYSDSLLAGYVETISKAVLISHSNKHFMSYKSFNTVLLSYSQIIHKVLWVIKFKMQLFPLISCMPRCSVLCPCYFKEEEIYLPNLGLPCWAVFQVP